jgi:inner membrane transporter RhtA
MSTGLRYRVPAPVLFVIGAVSMYAGAAMAVGLFGDLAPAAVAVLRMLGAAGVLVAWRRPGAAAWRGAVVDPGRRVRPGTAGMNIAFYEAIARLPLGTAVAIEFCWAGGRRGGGVAAARSPPWCWPRPVWR